MFRLNPEPLEVFLFERSHMSKRFTDTEKWDRPWFRKLPPRLKCLWSYMVDHCDQIGIWYVDFELASMFIGEPIDASEATNLFGKQIELLDPSRWLIKDFVSFQYGDLKPTNNFHLSLMSKIEKSGVSQGLTSPKAGDKEKEYMSLKSLEEKGGVGEKEEIRASDAMFNSFWLEYPRKVAKVGAKKSWDKLRPSEELFRKMIEAVRSWKKSDQWLKDGGSFIPHAATWINQRRWEDEINTRQRPSTGYDKILAGKSKDIRRDEPVGSLPDL